jgi:PadR family transcriptional regulator PadR
MLTDYTDHRYTVNRDTLAAVREPTFFVLTALLPGPLHGYGIIKSVEEMSGGRVTLRAGTLYAALERLEKAGAVALDREESEGGPPRRYYRLTPEGIDLLEAEQRRLEENASLVREGLRQVRPA